MSFRVLAIGDIVGTPGRQIVRELLSKYVKQNEIDFVVANGENIVSGSGLTLKAKAKLLSYGVDVITSGDHIWKRMEIAPGLEPGGRLLRPHNYPKDAPGSGLTIVKSKSGILVAVINILGRIFMDPIDCPFKSVNMAIEEASQHTRNILVDFHTEATSEKVAMGWYLNGRVSAIWGTHTHIQTADDQILFRDTAYITDLGMTGAHRSVLGRKIEPVLKKLVHQLPARFDVADEDLRISGIIVTLDPKTGRASEIQRVQIMLPLGTQPC